MRLQDGNLSTWTAASKEIRLLNNVKSRIRNLQWEEASGVKKVLIEKDAVSYTHLTLPTILLV